MINCLREVSNHKLNTISRSAVSWSPADFTPNQPMDYFYYDIKEGGEASSLFR